MPFLMLRRVWCLVLFVSMASLCSADTFFRITDYEVDLEMRTDATLRVSERITVTFTAPQRGIFRKIPINNPRVFIRDVRARYGDGSLLQKELSYDDGSLNIRLGDPDVTLPTGQEIVYLIDYVVDGAIRWHQSDGEWGRWAELNWDAIGHEWGATIRRSLVTVTFPQASQHRATVFSGLYGSTRQMSMTSIGAQYDRDDMMRMELGNDFLRIDRDRSLPPLNGMTVVVGIPEEMLPPPPLSLRIRNNWKLVAGVIVPVITFLVLFPIWLAKGRDPRVVVDPMRFGPPAGMEPALCGLMHDGRVHSRDFVAAFVSLANKGYLTFENSEGKLGLEETYLVRTGKMAEQSLDKFEALLLKELNIVPGSKLALSEVGDRLRTGFPKLVELLKKELVTRGYYSIAPDSASGGTIVLGLIGVFILTIAGLAAVGEGPQMVSFFLGGFVAAGLVVLFGLLMPARTPKGAKAMGELLGFYETMKRRTHSGEWTDLSMDRYEEMLPYAIAFGLSRQWNQINLPVTTRPPRWFHHSGRRPDDWNVHSFTNCLNLFHTDMETPLARAMAPSGSSSGGSGFSGGGFSGGGGGGGGGGSW